VVALVAAVAGAGIILAAWFPAGGLLAQRRTLSETAATLGQLRTEDAALRAESKNLSNPSEIARIARQQFQLIAPGEEAFQILPPPGQPTGATDPYAGDPGNESVGSPSLASAGGEDPTSAGTHGAGHAHTAPSGVAGLFDRVLQTLEFWR